MSQTLSKEIVCHSLTKWYQVGDFCLYCAFQFSGGKFHARWYLRAPEGPHALRPVALKDSLSCCLLNSSNVRLTDDVPFSSFQGRPLSGSSFYASLLKSIDGAMPLVFVSARGCLELLNTSDLPKSIPLVMVTLSASLSAGSFLSTPGCPGQYVHSSLRRYM